MGFHHYLERLLMDVSVVYIIVYVFFSFRILKKGYRELFAPYH